MRNNPVTTSLHHVALCAAVLFAALSCARHAHVLWQQRFASGLGDDAVSVVTDGNDIIVGATCRDSAATGNTAWELLRCDPNGKQLWEKTYDRGSLDFLLDLAVASDHDIIAVGAVTLSAADQRRRLLLSRFSPAGVPRWQKEYDFGAGAEGAALTIDSSGRITVCGTVTRREPAFNSDILIAQFDADGNLLDHETLDFGANEYGLDVARYKSERATPTFAAGRRIVPPEATDSLRDRDIVIVGLDPYGGILWRESYPSGGKNPWVRLAGLSAAVSSSAGIHVLSLGNRWGNWEILQDTRYPGDSNAICLGLTADRGGHILGVGTAGPEGHRYVLGWDCFRGKFFKFLPGGGYVPGRDDRATAVALDAAGNAIVVGTSGAGKDAGVLILKVALPHYKPPPDLWLPNMYR